MVRLSYQHVLTTLAFAAPSRRAPDVRMQQPSPLLLPDRGQRLQRSRQLPKPLEQLDPAPLPTDTQSPTRDDASDAPSAPEAAVVDLWTYQAEGGALWGAVANRSQLALWLQYELGLPAAELEPRCMLETLPLANRGTQRRLRRLWQDRRLLLQGVMLNELTDQAGGSLDDDVRAERAFRRKLTGYVRRVQRISPSRHEKVPCPPPPSPPSLSLTFPHPPLPPPPTGCRRRCSSM